MTPGIIFSFIVITGVAVYLFAMFSRIWRKEREILVENNEKLRTSNRDLEAQLKFMKETLDRYENGECIQGTYCELCKSALTIIHKERDLLGTHETTQTLCRKNISCPAFEQVEDQQ